MAQAARGNEMVGPVLRHLRELIRPDQRRDTYAGADSVVCFQHRLWHRRRRLALNRRGERATTWQIPRSMWRIAVLCECAGGGGEKEEDEESSARHPSAYGTDAISQQHIYLGRRTGFRRSRATFCCVLTRRQHFSCAGSRLLRRILCEAFDGFDRDCATSVLSCWCSWQFPMRHPTQDCRWRLCADILASYRTISRGADGSVPYAEPLGQYP